MRFLSALLLLQSIILGDFIVAQSTCTSQRYTHPIFPQVTEFDGVNFADADPFGPLSSDVLEMDIYMPTGDTLSRRPLIVFMHGGVFLVGWEGQPPIPEWAEYFAKRGYVVASIEYRLGFNPLVMESAVRAVYRAGQDLTAAFRYLADNTGNYRIDTAYFYAAGTSSGAITSLHTAYYEPNERPLSTFGIPSESSDLGCGTCSGNSNFNNEFVPIKGVISYWGGVLDTLFIGSPKNVPVLSVHGSEDETVHTIYGAPFSADGLFPNLYGSVPIHERLDNQGIYNQLYIMQGAGHEPELDNLILVPEYLDTMLLLAEPFLHSLVQPKIEIISGLAQSCPGDTATYQVPFNNGSQYCWDVTGGILLEDNGHQIKVRWPNLGNYSVSVTEKNYIQAVSDTIQHLVQVTSVQAVANLEVTQIDDSTFLFTDQSVNANFILLDFGDGSSAEILLPGDSILHTYNGSGDFVVSLWAANQCTEAQDSATISITEINGILQSSLFDGISIFPSPAKEWVQIDGVSPKYGELKLQVFSAKGKLWKTLSLNRNMKIAVSDWPIGTYFFRVEMAGHSKLFPTVIAN